MSTVIMCFCVFSLSGFFALLVRKNLEEQLPLSVCAMVGVLYLFGLAGKLIWGVYAVLGMSAAAALLCLAWLVRLRLERPLRYLVTPGSVLGLLAFVWVFITLRKHVLIEWDEFSHWGLAVKNMMHFGALPQGVEASSITYRDYPPAATLWQYLYTAFSGGFNEGDMQRAMNVMLVSFLLPMLNTQRWKRLGSALCMAGVLFLLPVAYQVFTYRFLFVDALLGVLLWYVLWVWFVRPRDGQTTLMAACGLAMMVLTKEAGLGLALVGLGAIGVDLWREGKQRHSARLTTFVVLLGVMAVAKISWSMYLNTFAVEKVWNVEGSFSQVLSTLRGDIPAYRRRGLRNFLVEFTKPAILPEGAGVQVNFLMWTALIWAAIAFVASRMEYMEGKRMRRMFGVLFAGFAVYVVFLLYTYMFLMKNYEFEALFSFWRYMSSMLIPITGLLVVLCEKTLGEHMARRGQSVALILLIILMLMNNTRTVLETSFINAPEEEKNYQTRMTTVFPEEYRRVLNDDDRVYFIDQEDMSGKFFYITAYEIAPVHVQPVESGFHFLREAIEVLTPDDWEIMFCSVVRSPEDWAQELKDGGYDYVYVSRTDAEFNTHFGSLFDQPVQNATLYHVVPTESGVSLSPVNP